jgi:hypothetical protein
MSFVSSLFCAFQNVTLGCLSVLSFCGWYLMRAGTRTVSRGSLHANVEERIFSSPGLEESLLTNLCNVSALVSKYALSLR